MHSGRVYSPQDSFDLLKALSRVAHWFPTQGPIKDFIHHNTLHAFQDRSFHEGIAVASELYGAQDYLPLEEYRRLYQEGRISDESLSRSLKKFGVEKHLLNEAYEERVPFGRVKSGVRSRWRTERNVDLDRLVHPMLFKLISGFLDQGICIWRMPYATDTFWNAVGRLVSESWLSVTPLSDPLCRSLLAKTPIDAALECLHRVVGVSEHYEAYLLEMLLAHPGWSGMVSMVERDPSSLLSPRKVSLLDFAALELVLEVGWLVRRQGAGFSPIANDRIKAAPPPEKLLPNPSPLRGLKRVWHEAMEWTVYERFLQNFALHKKVPASENEQPSVQAFFCLDDRACSLRRHLEDVRPDVATYGTAGFFGIDFLFQAAGSDRIVRYCPVVLTPRHLVREMATHEVAYRRKSLLELLQFNPETNTLFRGWLLTQTIGFLASLRLALKVFHPGSRLLADRRLTRVERPTKLKLLRESEETTKEGYWIGYSISEMADRVQGVLKSIGLLESFAPLVVLFGHGSTSANNPHFAAYDCGACAGRPGAPNARAFAWMANHPQVRRELAARGVNLPADCHFVGAVLDTARDEVGYFDLELLPQSHEKKLKDFDSSLQEALKRNARERCQRFELAPKRLSPEQALEHVRERSTSIFEPRPELNHATNAFCIIGRRSLTRSFFLDRRAFLNSYDPDQDPTGDVLASILTAAVPVCGGINLEYFFSRVDNAVYGAGTKLPHNVVSLLGVANGIDGDLRTGLPSQMVDIHDPVRLFILVEQNPEVALQAAQRHAQVLQWIANEWVIFGCLSPLDREVYVFDQGKMVPFQPSEAP